MADIPGRVEFAEVGGGADRRRAQRIMKSIDLKFELVSLPGEKELIESLDRLLVAQTHDLSETGICMWTTRVFTPASVIEVEFPGPKGSAPFRVRARVVWCQPHTEGGYLKSRMGLDFMDITPELNNKLLAVIKE